MPGGHGPGFTAPARQSSDLGPIMGYVAGGTGVLAFIWGFLDFYKFKGGGDNAGVAGYSGLGAAAVALVLAAGLVAVLAVLAKKPLGTVPLAVSAAGLLVVFGQLVKHGDGYDTGIGLILLLITSLVQVGALGYEFFALSKGLGGGAPGAAGNSFAPQGSVGGYGSPGGVHGQPGQYDQPGQYGQPGQYDQPGQYGQQQYGPQGYPNQGGGY